VSETIHWVAGDPAIRAVVEDWWADPEGARVEITVLRDNPRRRLVRLDAETVGSLLVKQYRLRSGRHPLRERIKAWLRRAPSDREFRTLVRLREAHVPVPPPLARGALPGGDRLIVTRFFEGRDLTETLAEDPKARRHVLETLGATLATLHARGFVHGDLHGGNVLWTGRGAVLVDLQHARATRRRRAQVRDLARLDYALWAAGVSRTDRVRLRAAALSLRRPFDPRARRRLREVGRAADVRAREHAESRLRRALRVGRRFARLRLDGARGLRLRAIGETEVAAAFDAHRAALARDDARVLKNDGRSAVTAVAAGAHRVVVKQVLRRSLARRLGDVFRGSPARRAWVGGHGLAARWIGTALPLAFLERRRLGVPVASWVVLEDLRPAAGPADALAGDPALLSRAVHVLADLARDLHARGADHGDLKASHVWMDPAAPRLAPRLLDLEGVRFRRRLNDRRRLRALAQLNASLPDRFPDAARRAAFLRYARHLPFRRRPDRVLRRLVRESRARRHRWTGSDCAL